MNTPNTTPTPDIVEIQSNPDQDGLDIFHNASQAIFQLERFLRRRELNSKMCLPLYRMRQGIAQLQDHYMANRTVCDKRTSYDKYAELPQAEPDMCKGRCRIKREHQYLDPDICKEYLDFAG